MILEIIKPLSIVSIGMIGSMILKGKFDIWTFIVVYATGFIIWFWNYGKVK